ncbi:MAG: L-serine ammonia-lyase, iron-sulfur-dependent, subunit alpha, partial [Candidatus Aminicenantes bacterium]
MEFISILNDVMGPVMRGPSSSHTAGSYRIGRMARSLFGECPASVTFRFDPAGSYGRVYREQGADLAFISGILNVPIIDDRFHEAHELADREGIRFVFEVSPLEYTDHPNTVHILMESRTGRKLNAVAQSVGGGMVVFKHIDDFTVDLRGKAYEYIVVVDEKEAQRVIDGLTRDQNAIGSPICHTYESKRLCQFKRLTPLDPDKWAQVHDLTGVICYWSVDPVFYVQKGEPLFSSAREMLAIAEERKCSLGHVALLYEAEVLGLREEDIWNEMEKRLDVMDASIHQGAKGQSIQMQLLYPSAPDVLRSVSEGNVAVGGIHAKAAGRAMAVCHVSNSMGIVCASPTGGSSGVIPAVITSMAEEFGLKKEQSVMGLLAASGIGLIIAKRATFAAEIAGCQVEIGAAGAMAAAAVVEMA